ncbi:hypothetical protein [Deinococcus yavapaiensis]|uniref:Uncharacterized protein n=1 Tax=Deinococcus yavapaiensis KR-236 TaxID=694435 RepID=A0A318SAL4_9DEIO|nr:hypothetical protein [Deinococcus yavapaiensis]PYE55448.1 hypothetical protein DES52_103281 [Deinococcus yavapaiensis KR-236]
MHIRFAPVPPEFTLDLPFDTLVRKDARFTHLARLRARGVLDHVVQDSADLQQAHLVVGSHVGTPGRTAARHAMFEGWSLGALEYALGFDSTCVTRSSCDEPSTWSRGIAFLVHEGRVSRRLDLSDDADRFELDWSRGARGVSAHLHRLDPQGRLERLVLA